jgi:hypothetical protein
VCKDGCDHERNDKLGVRTLELDVGGWAEFGWIGTYEMVLRVGRLERC